MKMTIPKIVGVLWVTTVLGIFVPSASADISAAKADDHGITIASRTGAKIDRLATLLTQHAKRATVKTKQVVSRAATHVENAGHKAGHAVKKTANKVEQKFEKLTD